MDPMHLTFEEETDGRWIAAVEGMPGALAYGATRDEARARVQALALRVLAERLEHGELPATTDRFVFEAAS